MSGGLSLATAGRLAAEMAEPRGAEVDRGGLGLAAGGCGVATAERLLATPAAPTPGSVLTRRLAGNEGAAKWPRSAASAGRGVKRGG